MAASPPHLSTGSARHRQGRSGGAGEPRRMTNARTTTAGTTTAAAATPSMRTDIVATSTSVMPFGIVLGVAVTGLGVGPAAGILGAATIYAGSAQLTAMTLMSGGAGVAAVVAAASLVNSRLLLYGTALEPHFRRQPLWFRLLGAHFIIDGTYLAAAARTDLDDPAAFRRYWWRIGTGVLLVWTSAVALGVALRPVLPAMPHLGLVAVALFLALLLPRLSERPARAAAAAAAVAAPLADFLVPSLGILAGALAGVAVGALSRRRTL